jgi:hypothetical protein
LASAEGSKGPLNDARREFAPWEDAATGEYLAGDLSAVDLTVYPFVALFVRHADRRADFVKDDVIGPRLALWMDRMRSVPLLSGRGRLIGNQRPGLTWRSEGALLACAGRRPIVDRDGFSQSPNGGTSR